MQAAAALVGAHRPPPAEYLDEPGHTGSSGEPQSSLSNESSNYEQTSESVLFQPQLEPRGQVEALPELTARASQQAPQQPSQWRLRAEGMLKKMTEPEPEPALEPEVCYIAY